MVWYNFPLDLATSKFWIAKVKKWYIIKYTSVSISFDKLISKNIVSVMFFEKMFLYHVLFQTTVSLSGEMVAETMDNENLEEKSAYKGSAFFAYIRSAGNCCSLGLIVFFLVFTQVLLSSTDYWITLWWVADINFKRIRLNYSNNRTTNIFILIIFIIGPAKKSFFEVLNIWMKLYRSKFSTATFHAPTMYIHRNILKPKVYYQMVQTLFQRGFKISWTLWLPM